MTSSWTADRRPGHCYDLRFPGLFQLLGDRGAALVVAPASWGAGPGKRAQWDLLVRARALDSTTFVAACDQADPATVGRDPGRAPTGIGASAVVGPLRELVDQLGAEPGLLVVDIDPGEVDAARKVDPGPGQPPPLSRRRCLPPHSGPATPGVIRIRRYRCGL